MKLMEIFKKRTEKKKPLWETDFKEFARNAGEKEIDEYTKAIPIKEGREIDYTNQCWGHAFTKQETYGELIHFGMGFYGTTLGSRKITEGDILLLNTSKNKTGKYLVLKIDYENDPHDMYWAYIVCIGYKK